MENLILNSLHLKIVLIFAVGFGFASVLGYFSHLFHLSPVLGYLLAGYLIGPYSPGFVADLQIAEQLAEVGIILMMFSVGLHIQWRDLFNVRKIAIPGAIGQTGMTSLIASLLIHHLGWPIQTGMVLGFAIGVASTVVLMRVLSEQHLLHTEEGHISIGWLIVEDLLTVVILLLLPIFALGQEWDISEIAISLGVIVAKSLILLAIMVTIGHRVVHYLIAIVLRSGSQELFTLSILSLTFIIAIGASLLCDISIALGAFIAGVTIGQTAFRNQVSIDLISLRDIFVVVFFLSVGTLFNPIAIWNHFPLFIGVLAIIIFIKPFIAFMIAWFLKYPKKTALVVAVALAQIGEFSFILSEKANHFGIIPDEGYDVIVACALISISINPLLFRLVKKLYI